MTPKVLLRIASLLLFIFAAGHTTGHLGRKNTTDPRAQALITEMENYHFDFKGTSQTLDGHMEGYGWMTTVLLVSLAAILWIVSSSYSSSPSCSSRILCCVTFFMTGNAYVAFRYFFPGPGIFSVLVILLIGISIFRMRNITATS